MNQLGPMEIFLTTVLLTFVIFAGAVLYINYCKTKPANEKHQLTGMCHKSGGVCCGQIEIKKHV